MLKRAIKNISRYLEKNQKGLAIILVRQNFFFLLKKGVTAGEFLRILWMVIQNGINKADIYVIKTRFGITTLPKVGSPGV